jgi:urease gamma subunit
MSRRNRKGVEIKYPEIAVFVLSKGLQMNERVRKGKGYYYMLNIIETLMRDSNVVSGKVGISGYKEDVAAYLAALLEVYFYKDIELYLMDDINEFDPDILPNKFR